MKRRRLLSLAVLGSACLIVELLRHPVHAQDGNLYLMGGALNGFWRFDGDTGGALPVPGQSGAVFVANINGGLANTQDLAFGPDGNLHCIGSGRNAVLRYDGGDGTFIDAFVPDNSEGIPDLLALIFPADRLAAILEAPARAFYHLLPGVPNPINPRITIGLELDRAIVMNVGIVDLRGDLNRTLHVGWLAAGHHDLIWDGRDDSGMPSSSGTYNLVRASAGKACDVQKIVLIR